MRIEIFILTLLLVIVKSSERAYDRIADCESEIEPSTAEIKSKADKISRKFEDNDLLKNDGALGIVGGMSGSPIPLYFAAMAAHRVRLIFIITSISIN